jgi:two-component system chemotaxis response regulator CheB
MDDFAVVVIGASLGGVEALRQLAAGLRPDIHAALFVVQHMGRDGSRFPELLNRSGRLPAVAAAQGEAIRPGRIYVAPVDHHLLLEPGRVRLTRGPRENWARPAIDPLFRSAAKAYGPRTIGVILTGYLNDGSAGAARGACRRGPRGRPRPRGRHSSGHAVECAAPRRRRLPGPYGGNPRIAGATCGSIGRRNRTKRFEVEGEVMSGVYRIDQPTALTCPECGGLWRGNRKERCCSYAATSAIC